MSKSSSELADLLPVDFVLGAATAAYQIEGAVSEGGRGVSIWDTFSHTHGKTLNGDHGDIACDHYHRWAEDLDLMASLGINAYRLNFSWVRLQPTGRGGLNSDGIRYYRELIEGCLERGIEPYVTLYHWDLPQALQDQGGWANRETAMLFAEFAENVVPLFCDLVTHWITINEPWCVAFLGHSWGLQAPGIQDEAIATRAIHHVLLAHGLATQRIKKIAPGLKVGVTNLLSNVTAASASSADISAAKVLFTRMNRITLDPIYLGGYSEDVFEVFEQYGLNRSPSEDSLVQPGDLEIISTQTDFAGVNHYTNVIAAADSDNHWSGVRIDHVEPTPSSFGWSNTPAGLAGVLQFVNRDFTKLPILITENGISLHDYATPEGEVRDPIRIDYLSGYLGAVLEQLPKIPVIGYFIWSFMDNFEWAEGYSKRFGLIYVDYPTQKRIPKASAYWLKELLAKRKK